MIDERVLRAGHDEHLEVLVGGDQPIGQPERVVRMDLVVHLAVDQQEVAGQPVGEVHVGRAGPGLGIVEAAKRAGISPGFLSSVERGQANASVATLQRLATAYGATVMDLFRAPKGKERLVRPSDRRVLQMHSGVRMEMLSSGATMLQSMLFRVAPLAGSDGAYSHQGEEFIYMLSGTLEVWLDELECFVLHEGDSFWFESTLGHRWFNPGKVDAVLLWINTPPTF